MVRKILHEWVAGEKTLPEATADWLDERTPRDIAVTIGYFLGQAIVVSSFIDAAAGWWWGLVHEIASMPRAEAAIVLLLGVVAVQLGVLVVDVRRIAERVRRYSATPMASADRGNVVNIDENLKCPHGEAGAEPDQSGPRQADAESLEDSTDT